ncbi:glucan endo-1,3-beta-glucosidase 7-like [Primulina huaijiensis]|uniref:glucan endo-1,3-beta-glucosidase 7-like n=1 Tax=Primulina huaijiensis TaxID=1492673 RepID=UPI003CC71CA2
MATLKAFSCSFLLLLSVSACMGRLDWCIVLYYAPPTFMQHFLDEACSRLDCSAVKPGGDCFLPDGLINHVSYVLNLNYRATKKCPTYIATISLDDPSYDKCKYT